MTRRRMFATASFISLLACLLCLGNVLAGLHGGLDRIYWDRRAGDWLPVPRQRVVAEAYTAAGLAPLFGIAPALWLRRFVREQRSRNRVWRGQCGSCGYDLRAATVRCPECGAAAPTVAPPPHTRRLGPGTEATLMLAVVLPIVTAVAFALLVLVLFLASDGV